MDLSDPSFGDIVSVIFAIMVVIGIGLALWAAGETPASRQARHERYQQQDWVSTQFQRRQRADAAYRENALAKIDASRRSPVRKVA